MAGIDRSEVTRRKAAGECHRCTWPQDRRRNHKTIDCFRWARKERGTALVPKHYQQIQAEIEGIGSRAIQSNSANSIIFRIYTLLGIRHNGITIYK